ncbi:MAG: hypothetical protein NTW19_16475 [Planctomycetota bacterium]|nr:hypothetical protein [Planctomycetota bacterium]
MSVPTIPKIPGRPLRIVVLGMMGRCPFGGQSWLYLNWMRGLHRLGHHVWYVEDDSVWPYDPVQNSVTDDCAYATRHIARSLEKAQLPERWAFRLADRKGACWGMTEAALDELYRECDVLLNIVGATDLGERHLAAKYRVYLETDPVTAELRLAMGDAHTKAAFDNHHVVVTYGENYGSPDCGVPLNGIKYLKTRQPIDLDLWPMAYDAKAPYFTTIGNYKQNGNDVEYNGQSYRWSKHHEWEKFWDLPGKVKQEFELAMNVDAGEDHKNLESRGWRLTSPLQMSLDIFGAYPAYFRGSRAEFTVAKDQNVRLRSGWFSERDVCYLACGKPVIAQDTGFSNILPTGKGLFGFTKMEQAVEAVNAINADYEGQCKAAREIAREWFDCKMLAEKLLKDIGLA